MRDRDNSPTDGPETKIDFSEGRPIASVEALLVSQEELPQLEEEALKGSGEAAYRLALHYQASRNIIEAMKWFKVGAEKGSYSAMYAYALRLDQFYVDIEHKSEAKCWYQRVANEAHEPLVTFAKRALERMESR